MQRVINYLKGGNLVLQIVIGLVFGVIIALISKDLAISVGILGDLFIGALKAVAPILIFILVIVAIATKPMNVQTGIRPILVMYLIGMLLASFAAVVASFIFPVELVLSELQATELQAPVEIQNVLKDVLFKAVDNPVHALATANFIGVLAWGIGIGLALHHGSTHETKMILKDVNAAALKLVRFIIRLAPFGIFGIMAKTFAETGFDALKSYSQLILVLVGAMLFVTFVVNPIIMYVKSKRNPYPLVLTCLKESGVTAFFTRSSAANTLGIPVTLGSAIFLCVIASLGACGTSGVAGGSLLLIPLACSLFNIDNDIAMKVVGIGFIVGGIQDSVETALNSSTDVMFTAAASKTPPILDFN